VAVKSQWQGWLRGYVKFARLRPYVNSAKVAELVDALDLGSSARKAWGFESPLSHWSDEKAATHQLPALDFQARNLFLLVTAAAERG
jgi:hypothetical protein